MKKERIVWFDYLRVLATISVVVLHTASQKWYTADPRGLDWNVINIYDGLVRWGVPVFVMISGALFLPREIPTKTLYTKYILKMICSFAFWSVVYGVGLPFVMKAMDSGYELSYSTMAHTILTGFYHMWFIPMLMGIYMCIPIIRQILRSETVTRYFLILSFGFVFVIPQVVNMVNDFLGGYFAKVINDLNEVKKYMQMGMISGFGLYFVLGYLLSRRELSKKQRYIVYALGVVGFAATIGLSSAASYRHNQAWSIYYHELSVNVFLTAVAVYVWFKHRKFSSKKWNRLFSRLSKYSFGVYLVHIFVMRILRVVGLYTGAFPSIVSIPVVSLTVVVISYLVSWGLNKLPVVRKWFV